MSNSHYLWSLWAVLKKMLSQWRGSRPNYELLTKKVFKKWFDLKFKLCMIKICEVLTDCCSQISILHMQSMVTKTFSRLNPTNYIKRVRNHKRRTTQSFPGTRETWGDDKSRSSTACDQSKTNWVSRQSTAGVKSQPVDHLQSELFITSSAVKKHNGGKTTEGPRTVIAFHRFWQ